MRFHCDWLGRNRLITTRAVHHLATATFGNGQTPLVATPSELFDWQVRYLDIDLLYVYDRDIEQCQQHVVT